ISSRQGPHVRMCGTNHARSAPLSAPRRYAPTQVTRGQSECRVELCSIRTSQFYSRDAGDLQAELVAGGACAARDHTLADDLGRTVAIDGDDGVPPVRRV